MRKKVLSLVLALCMVLTLVPGTAFAAAEGSSSSDVKLPDAYNDSHPVDSMQTGTITVTNSGAEGQSATNFADAVSKVTDGGTITISGGKVELSATADFSDKSVTIKSEDNSAIVRGETFTDTMFKVGASKTLSIEGVIIDAGGKWSVDNEKLIKSVELSLAGENALDGSGNYIGGAEDPVTTDAANVISTGNLFEINAGSKLVFDNGAIVKNYYKTNGHIINITGDGANIDFKECHIEHNLTSGSGIVNYGGSAQKINILNGAEFANNFTTNGHGGIVYLRNANSELKIGENSDDNIHIHDNISMKCNGGIVITYTGGVATLNGGIIEDNIAVRGNGSTYAMMFYAHSNGTIIMNGGSILNNVGSSVSAISQNIAGAGKVELNGGTIKGNRHANEAQGAFGAQGDVFISAEGTLGANMNLEDDLYIYGQGIFTMEEGSTVKGDVCVYSEQYHEVTDNKVDLKGKIEGSLYIQDGAKVENSGEITGNVILVERDEDDSQDNLFTNTGKVDGNIQLAKGGKAVNEGTIQGTTDVKAGAELVLHGHGTLQGTVTVYPGGDIRAAENDSAEIDGHLIIEYKDAADLERMQDIFRASGITIKSGEAPEYKLHEHTKGAAVADGHKAPTCTEPGYDTYTCTTCLDEYQVAIDALGHLKPSSGTEKKPTLCTEPTTTEYTCARQDCNFTWEEVTTPATTHVLVPGENGSLKCSNAGCTYTETISQGSDPLCADGNHAWTESVTKAATCTTKGEHTLTCQKCGATLKIDIPTTDHTWSDLKVDEDYDGDRAGEIKDATCTVPGLRTLVKTCTVCGETDEASRIFETIPMTEHTAPVGTYKTDGSGSKCTDEFTAQCTVCGQEVEFRGIAHTWGTTGTSSVCSVCGETRDTNLYVTIDYQYPGAMNPPQSVIDADHILYAHNSTASLWKPAEGEAWRETLDNVPVVFIGWSETYVETPFTAAPETNQTVTEVTLADRDKVVYAVWAQDLNSNGQPDYDETKFTITFDIGTGATGTKPADMTGLLAGIQYNLPQPSGLVSGENIFAGWSTESNLGVLTDHSKDSSLVFHYTWDPATEITESNKTVTFHAVYAAGSYKTGSAQVSYHVNGGVAQTGANVTITDGIFYTCSHFHAVGSSVTTDDMFSVDAAKDMIRRQDATLVGWSLTQIPDPITQATELTHSVTLLEGGATLYAVWAVDKNGNDVPDYLEEDTLLTPVWYDNADLDGTLPADVTPEIEGTLPSSTAQYHIGAYIEFNFSGTLTRTDYKADGSVYHHYVQLGWSKFVHGVANNATQAASWLLTPDSNPTGAAGKTYRWLRDARSQYAYAVWAIDDNENGVPDYADVVTPPTTQPEPSSPSFRPAPSARFSDVSQTAWYVSAIDYVVKNGLMDGVSETDFAPEAPTTRAMLVTILYRLDGESAVTKNIPFSDVASGEWYSDAINWAAANGIVGGYGDDTFRPTRELTREEAATILYRYATYKKYDVTTTAALTGYTDAASVQSYATAPMSWAVGTELIGGTTATTLAPNGGAIRAQIATILMRFCENIVK